MPVVGIPTARLRNLLGRDLEGTEIADAIDRLGCDLEEVADVIRYECPACRGASDRLPREDAPTECSICGVKPEEPFIELGQDEVVRLDLLPARPDLFDAAGLSRALKGYLGIQGGLPVWSLEEGDIVVRVDPGTDAVRPHIACAEVVLPPIDHETLIELFQLQENLHWAVGRDRKKASIGIYDMSTLTREILWTTEPRDYEFVPLGMPGQTMSLSGILADHPKGQRYAKLLEPYDRYPILVDDRGQVLSMPPIINSEETKLRLGSESLFVDVTGHDIRAVEDCLALVVATCLELGATVRTVRIVRDGGEKPTPDLTPVSMPLSPERTAALIGIPMERTDVIDCLGRMRLGVADDAAEGELTVEVPRYRVDVKHEVDLIEDVAIAHGYHNLPSPLVPTMTVGKGHPLLERERVIRRILVGLGFTEIMTFVLTSREEHLIRLNLSEEAGQVNIANPISVHQEIVRTHLLSGLMTTFAKNKTREMPQRIFEVGDIALGEEERSEQHARLSIGVMGARADYAEIRSTVDALLGDLGLDARVAPDADGPFVPMFIPGRVAKLMAGDVRLGTLGEVSPEVLDRWGLDHPVVVAELDVEVLGQPLSS